ncbi:6-phosphogluconolactonase [Campylobacter sp. MIT 21-1685]|uniref:6-phosphogluconolactonase n=1 Tax=unclassified Campylobacter TaxID=2593542 RepID=UPI00224A571E|nr:MULTISPECIES: 6-phosphogluconolactonase [unclassified Campylobacter]MCX2683805.1 6-phosphogluconolactonase [Campylobacter sp. MIT 21-1684]MCX2752089.1 6-phosphogluconolactonase [Campylobacter sp. MIT 21-1682]MCX2808282.1 6-phosphogluconolactonase [Campylobacter sp. MIT 21-1685]
MAFKIYEFADATKCNFALIEALHILCSQSIKEKDYARLNLSGGKSPLAFFKLLSQQKWQWSKMYLSLVDERIVECNSDESNAHFLEKYLLQNFAVEAHFTPLLENPNLSPQELLNVANKSYKQPDFAVLGMGLDGHTASLFSEADEFENALQTDENIVLINPKNAPYQRLSMSFAALFKCKKLFLSIAGAQKREIFDKAALSKNKSLPLSYILHSKEVECDVYFA